MHKSDILTSLPCFVSDTSRVERKTTHVCFAVVQSQPLMYTSSCENDSNFRPKDSKRRSSPVHDSTHTLSEFHSQIIDKRYVTKEERSNKKLEMSSSASYNLKHPIDNILTWKEGSMLWHIKFQNKAYVGGTPGILTLYKVQPNFVRVKGQLAPAEHIT